MTSKATLFILAVFSIVNCFGQPDKSKKRIPDNYSNWISIDYINCLKTDLPCECEKSKEYFLISLNTTKDIVFFYEGESNYETTTSIGQIEIKNDTLLFTDLLGKQTKFVQYSTGDYDAYLKAMVRYFL